MTAHWRDVLSPCEPGYEVRCELCAGPVVTMLARISGGGGGACRDVRPLTVGTSPVIPPHQHSHFLLQTFSQIRLAACTIN